MSSYAATYDRQSAPESWETTTYTVRRPGHTCWLDGIGSFADAKAEKTKANNVVSGHRIYMEQEYVGDLAALQGTTRTIEVG